MYVYMWLFGLSPRFSTQGLELPGCWQCLSFWPVTPDELLDEGWSPDRPSRDQKLGILSLTHPILLKTEKVWKCSQWLIMSIWWNLHKIPKVRGSESFQGGWTHPHQERVAHPNFTGTEAPAPGTLPDLSSCVSSLDFSSVSFITSFSKIANVSKCCPEFCEPL